MKLLTHAAKVPAAAQPQASGPDLLIQLSHTVIIDPQEALLDAVAGMVAARGHEVDAFASVAEARAGLESVSPDFLIARLDHATAADVLQLLQELGRGRHAKRPYVLALTNEWEPLERREAWLKYGIDDFFHFAEMGTLPELQAEFAVIEHLSLRLNPNSKPMETAAEPTAVAFKDIFACSPLAQLVLSLPECQILEANAAAQRLLGKSPEDLQEKFLSLALTDIYDHPGFSMATLERGDELLLNRVQLGEADTALEALMVDVNARSIPWGGGKAILMHLTNAGPSIRAMEGQLQASRMDASIVTLRGLAREISDALTSVRGNLEMLGRQPFPRQESKDHVEDAQYGLRRIEGYARKAAALARLQDTSHATHARLTLKPLLEKATAFALLDGHCTPVLDIPANLWATEGDSSQLTEAFLQLARNAAQSMPPGGHLFVTAENFPANEQSATPASVRIVLRDQGHGIAKGDFHRVQDPFFSTWGREGLGLTMAAATFRAHGGRMEMTSQPNEGTQVTVLLPACVKMPLAEIASGHSGQGAGVEPTPAVQRGPQRILFMDDDPQIRSLVYKILAAQGFSVYCTNDGDEAILAYRKAHQFGAPFDLIIMDLDVRGGMGGVQATQILKKEFPGIKAVLATGYVDDKLLHSHQDHGFLGVLLKPFEVERLLGIVAKLAS